MGQADKYSEFRCGGPNSTPVYTT